MTFSIADKLNNVRARIQKTTIGANRPPDSVQLLAVSKKHSAQSVYDAVQNGQTLFGENYLNEALAKQEALQAIGSEQAYKQVDWHFIGPIQSNKTRQIAENFAWVHTLERSKIVQRLNDQRPSNLAPLNCCIQINIDQEETKSGILLAELDSLAKEVAEAPNLSLRGLMCIPEPGQDAAVIRASFQRMSAAFDQLKQTYPSVDTLSMGMSADMDIAIECGSTLVRVGTAIFGERT
ncbi:MAG: YggS family pyridoxal phosphate-dependent enzyme [Oleiphilus sp.]